MHVNKLSTLSALALLILGGCQSRSDNQLGADEDHLRIVRDNSELADSLQKAIESKTSIDDVEKVAGKATINTTRDSIRELEIHGRIYVYRNGAGVCPDLWKTDNFAYWLVPPELSGGSREIMGLVWVDSRIELFTGIVDLP